MCAGLKRQLVILLTLVGSPKVTFLSRMWLNTTIGVNKYNDWCE